MDWWELILVCTAGLLTVCRTSEGTLLGGNDAMPGTHNKFNAIGCPPNTIFCMESMRCVNLDGTCIKPPTCESWEVLQETHLGLYTCVSKENEPVKVPEHCKLGQIYCFQEGRCVNMDGTCSDEPSCEQHQMLCNKDGSLACVDAGSCTHVEAGLYLENADFNGVVGPALERLTEFKKHLKALLTSEIPGSEPNDFYDLSIEPGSINIRLSASPRLLENLQELIASRPQFMTDLSGQPLHINYDKSYAELKKGYHVVCDGGTCTTCPVDQENNEMTAGCMSWPEYHHPDYEAKHDGERNCKMGQIFCLESLRCVNMDGTCDNEPNCGMHQVLCKSDRGVVCVDHGKCNFTEVWIYFGSADFTAVIGPDFENMKSFLKHIKGAMMTNIPGTLETDFWNFEAKPGSIFIGFSMNPMFYKRFMELKQSGSQFIKDFNGHRLQIDWDKSFAHQVFQDGYNTECRDGECISCPGDSLIDWDMKECVIYDNFFDDERDDHHNDDGNEGFSCGYNEIFCFETMSCVTPNGYCPHPDCGLSQKVCNIDGEFVCRSSCTYAKFVISMEGNFFEIVGNNYERYLIVKDSLTKQLAEALVASPNDFIDSYIWNGSLHFGGKMSYEFLHQLQELLLDKQSSLSLYLNEKQMIINFEKTYVYEETEYGDDYHHDDNDSDDKDHESCPECNKNGMTCEINEIFCFETMSCVTSNGYCTHPECGLSQKVCNIDGEFVCTPSCTYAKFVISMEGNFFEIVGRNYERYNFVKDSLTKQLAETLMASSNDFIESYIWNGSLYFGGKMSHEFLHKLQKVIIDDQSSLNLHLNEKQMIINFEKTHVYEETEYGDDYYHDDNDSDDKDHESCPECDSDGMTCGTNEIFCIESGGCVNIDGSCIDESHDCPYENEILCPDGTGNYNCKPRDECDNRGADEVLLHCNMTLDADFDKFVSHDNGDSVKNAVVEMLQKVSGVNQENIRDLSLSPGSIRVHLKLSDQLEKLKIFLFSIISYVKNNGTVDIGGKIVKISSFVYEGINDDEIYPDRYDKDGNVDKSMIDCPRPLIYCFETRQCVNENGTCNEDPEECTIPGQMPCDIGHGSFICKSVESCLTLDTTKVTLTIDGNYDNVVGENKEKAMQDIQTYLAVKLNIDSENLIVHDIKSGSIIVLFDIKATDEAVKAILEKLEILVANKEQVTVLGNNLPVIKYTISNGPEDETVNGDGGYSGKDENGDEKSVTCSTGQIFCIETRRCVYPDRNCGGDARCESPHEMPCNDGNGSFICKPLGSCGTFDAIKVTLKLDGNYNEVIGENKKMAMQDLQTHLAIKLNINADDLIVFDIISGSVIVVLDIKASDEDLDTIRMRLQTLVDNKEQVSVLGKNLTVIEYTISNSPEDETGNGDGSKSGNDDDGDDKSNTCATGQLFCFESNKCIDDCVKESKPSLCSDNDQIFCPGKNLCVRKDSDLTACIPKSNACNETHARCYNSDDAESAKCVPKQTCQMKLFCPIPQPDSVSTCQVTCNPKEDKTNINGQICCPNACGGENAGVFKDPLNYYACPRDENTGICLTHQEMQCDLGMIFCPAMDKCVKEDYDLTTCEQEVIECNEKQMYCLDVQGYGTCVPAGSCSIRDIKIKMVTDADFDAMITQEQKVINELIPQVKNLFNVDNDGIIKDIELFQGSLGILVTLTITDPQEAESVLSQLETMVQQSKVTFMILGTNYLVKPDSFKVAVDLVVFDDTDCKATDSCNKCVDEKAPCINLDGTKSVSCVPSYICRLESACPIQEKDTASKCQGECDPRQDKKSSDGKLCCPSSCSGESSGLYVEPVTRYVCPVNEDTGVCLTESDTGCESGKEWCVVTFTCESEDFCEEQALQQNVDEITKSELFILRIPLSANGLKFVTVFEPKESTTTFQQKVDNFANLMKEQLLNTLNSADAEVTINAVAVYPESKDTSKFSVYAEVRCKTLSANDIKEKINGLRLASDNVEFSLEPGKHPSVTAVLGLQSNQIFIIQKPVVAGAEAELGLFSVVLPTTFTSSSVNATLDCSETSGVNVVAGKSVAPSNEINSDQEFAIRHTLTDIQLVKCRLDTSQLKTLPDGAAVFIGFIAIPKDIGKLGTVTNIGLTKDQIQIDEDSDCISLPDNLFSIEHEGDSLFEMLSNYPAKMTGNNEVWKGPILNGLQELFLKYILTRHNVLKNLRVSVSITEDSSGSRPARLLYKDNPLRATGNTDLLSAEENLKYFKICVTADYNGAFNLVITEVIGEAGTPGQQIKVPIMVIGENDAPRITRKTDLLTAFTYPMVPTDGTNIEVPMFNVQKIMDLFAVDQDSDQLGMAVIGVSTKIEGKWEYSKDGGNTWDTLVAMDNQPDTDEITVEVVLLNPTDLIRFTVSESHKAVTWLLEEAPQIIALVWDGFKSDITMSTDTVTLKLCKTFETGLLRYCFTGSESSKYSKDIFRLPLARAGCDGEANSGKEMKQCGCGDDSSCLDCNNVINGDAKVDTCGICGGPNVEVNCDVDECRQLRSTYCERQEEFSDSMSDICKEGEILNKEHINTCGVCIKEGTAIETDKCGVPCGDNDCLDCAGEKGLYEVNVCKECKPINKLLENCGSDKITIGNILPSTIIPRTVMNITVDISGLTPNTKPEISECHLEAKEGNAEPPKVLTVIFVTNKPSIVLTIQANSSTGYFGIVCTIDGQVASTKDHDLYLWLYNQPTLSSVDPAKSLTSDISDITITGSGFFNTGVVICVRPCLPDETCVYKDAEGSRISDSKVTCPGKKLITRKSGQSYSIYIVLQKLQTVDIESLFESSGVQFSVILPPPRAISAVLDKNGCPNLIVTFSTKVIGTSGDSCTDYFTTPKFNHVDDKCMLPKGSRKMFIKFKTSIDAGAELIFKSDVISSASEHNLINQNIEKLTGSVSVQNDGDDEKGKPVVMIDQQTPKKVGCSPVTVMLRVINRGCWDINVSWTVSANGVDTEHITTLQQKMGTSTSFTISRGDLQDDIKYNFTAKWTAGKHNGEDSRTIMKDSESTAVVEIRGIGNDDIDPNEALIVKAVPSLCDDDLSIPTITWLLTPNDYMLKPTFKTRIPKGELQPRTQYNLTCKVTTGDATEINGFVVFKTKPRPIKPLIVPDNVRPTYEDTVTLTCSDQFDPTASIEDYMITWVCHDNVITGSEDEDEFKLCFEFSSSENKYVAVERSGHSITLDNADRMKARNGIDLIQKWTCEARRKSAMELVFNSSVKLKFTTEQILLEAPQIKSKTPEMIYLAEGESFVVKIHAKVRKATGCRWWTNDMDVDSEESEDILLDATKYRTSGPLERENIKYSETLYKMCYIKLNLQNANLVPAQTYVLKMFAYNKDSRFVVQNSREFKVMVVPHPTPGIIQIVADDSPVVALTTNVKITLDGWYDLLFDADLRCNFYYTNMDSQERKKTRINTVPVSMDTRGETTTLSEGKNKIEVECCNLFKKCTWMAAEDFVTAEPVDQTGVLTVIEQTLPQFLSLDKENTLSFVAQLKRTMNNKVVDEDKREQAERDLKQAMLKAIKRALEIASDIYNKLSVIQQTADAVETPEELDEEVKEDLKQNVKDILDEAVGKEKRRKRRSTTDPSEPNGLTEDEATTALKGLDTVISEETMNKDDADFFKTVIDEVMVAMCINFTGSEPWLAPAELSYVRLHKTNLSGYASLQSDVSCDTCPEVDYPAKVKYGSYLESYFEGLWNCTFYDPCIDVCVATAQINIDYVTLAAKKEVVAPSRKSDIIILRMISPENYAFTEMYDLPSPIEATLTLNGTLDMEKYDYKCLMWVSEDWSDQQCNISVPAIDQTTSQYTAVCTCNALGIISIFQELKQEEKIVTTTTTSSLTTTSTSSDQKVTTTPLSSKQLGADTKSAKIEFTFQEDYDVSVKNSVSAFNDKIKQDIVTGTGISGNSIKNFKSEKGSIIIKFELHQADSSLTLGQIVYTVENAITTDAITFTTPSGESLSIKPESFKYEEIKDDDDKDDDGDETGSSNLPIIIGAALGGLVIVCVTVVVVLLILKNKKQRTHPSSNATGPTPRYATPPPAYDVTQPPPPFLYEEPPQVNKWVEDELTKAQDGKQRPPSSRSGGSGTSYEQKLMKKGREVGPTPVGE